MLHKNNSCVFPFWREENFMILDNHDLKHFLKKIQRWISKKRIRMGGEE